MFSMRKIIILNWIYSCAAKQNQFQAPQRTCWHQSTTLPQIRPDDALANCSSHHWSRMDSKKRIAGRRPSGGTETMLCADSPPASGRSFDTHVTLLLSALSDRPTQNAKKKKIPALKTTHCVRANHTGVNTGGNATHRRILRARRPAFLTPVSTPEKQPQPKGLRRFEGKCEKKLQFSRHYGPRASVSRRRRQLERRDIRKEANWCRLLI